MIDLNRERPYTLQEVADILRVTRQSIYNYVKNKRLRAVKAGKAYIVLPEDLQAFLDANANK